jgi:hypothetical protein
MIHITIDTNRPEYAGEAKWPELSRVLRDLANKFEQYTQDRYKSSMILMDWQGDHTGWLVEDNGMIVALSEVLGESKATSNVTVSVEKDNLALIVHPEGMGAWDGPYAPILLERHQGKMRLVIWADINQQDPTHIIDLSGALESNRAADGGPVAISERA